MKLKTKTNLNNDLKMKAVHVISIFPSKSETFIVNFILESLKYNYSAQILADNFKNIDESSQKELLLNSGLYDNCETFNPSVSENKIIRLFQALIVLLGNLWYFKVFIRTLDHKKYGLKSKTLKMWFQAAIFLKHKDAQIFHAHFGINGKLLAEMKEIGAIKGKIITSFYGYDTFSTNKSRVYFRAYYKDAFNYSKHIITSSNYLLNNLIELNVPKDKVKVNSVGVDLNEFKFKNRDYSDTLKIITVGRLIKLKGQHLGIDVIKILKDRGHNVTFTIIGEGDEIDNLKSKINDLDLKDTITLNGGGSQHEIIKSLHQHHLFLMTSITDSTGRAEGQGLVSAEAQSTGMPVVGFESGGVPETILNGKTGLIVKEGDVNAMADAIETFILNKGLIKSMGTEARTFVHTEFNNTNQSQKLIDLYKN